MICKKHILMLALVTTTSFAYFNEEDYQQERGGWNNFNNTGNMMQNRYEYYKTGVVDTINILNEEQSNFFLDGKPVKGIDNKFVVIKQINKNNFADYIFMRSVSSKVSSQYPIAVVDGLNNGYLIFGYFDDKNSAMLLADKLQAYSIKAEILKPGTKGYIYRSPLKNIAIDDKLLENLKNNPAKVIVVEKTRYINGNPSGNSAGATAKQKNTYKTSSQSKKIAPKLSAQDTKEEEKIEAPIVSQMSDEDKIKCLEWLKKDLIQNGLYNIETKQIKYKGQIYGLGDNINFACLADNKVDFKITQMVRMNKNMSIIFNNLANKKLDIIIKYPQTGFVTIDDLFYNPDQPNITENVIFVSEEKKNSSQIIEEQPKQNNHYEVIIDYGENNASIASNTHISTPQVQNNLEQKTISTSTTTGTEQATCSFKIKEGIRTQQVKNVSGEYETKAIPTFYKNKILPIEYFRMGNLVAVTAVGAQSILINKEHFEKYCY